MQRPPRADRPYLNLHAWLDVLATIAERPYTRRTTQYGTRHAAIATGHLGGGDPVYQPSGRCACNSLHSRSARPEPAAHALGLLPLQGAGLDKYCRNWKDLSGYRYGPADGGGGGELNFDRTNGVSFCRGIRADPPQFNRALDNADFCSKEVRAPVGAAVSEHAMRCVPQSHQLPRSADAPFMQPPAMGVRADLPDNLLRGRLAHGLPLVPGARPRCCWPPLQLRCVCRHQRMQRQRRPRVRRHPGAGLWAFRAWAAAGSSAAALRRIRSAP